jgi:RES domain-containing protein
VLTAWRLTKTKHLATAWDGDAARRAGGRWNSVGTAVVYTSATLSLALAEILVHISAGPLPAYTAISIEFDDSLVSVLAATDVPADWNSYPPPASTQAIGDAWVSDARAVILRVPSVVVPVEFNYVLNPSHTDFPRVRIGAPMPFPFDPRLVQPQSAQTPQSRSRSRPDGRS